VCELPQIAQEITIGDTVAYTPPFPDRYSKRHSARGVVAALFHLDCGTILADILWDTPAMPRAVNGRKLSRIIAPVSGNSRARQPFLWVAPSPQDSVRQPPGVPACSRPGEATLRSYRTLDAPAAPRREDRG
jgi:hypothetical protein